MGSDNLMGVDATQHARPRKSSEDASGTAHTCVSVHPQLHCQEPVLGYHCGFVQT